MNAEDALAFVHLLSAFWYVMGLAAVQVSLARDRRSGDAAGRADALEAASHYQGLLLVPGAIAAGATGVFLWAQMGYNLVTTGWLLAQEGLYILTILVCLPLIGMGLRQARLAALESRKTGRMTPKQEQALADNAPLVFSGIATLLVPLMAFLAVFKPF